MKNYLAKELVMTVVEGFSIFGSLASAVAIIVSLIVFWVQRTNEKSVIEKHTQNELKALKILIYDEVRNNYIYFKQIMQFFDDVKNNKVASCRRADGLDEFYFNYTKEDGSNVFILARDHSSVVIDRYLLDISRIDDNLIGLLIDLKFLLDGFNKVTLKGLRLYFDTKPTKSELIDFVSDVGNLPYRYRSLCNQILSICNVKDGFKPYQI
ncbi:hypothetical protein [Providencia sp. JUb39]|uniref:hypothetical protein n=1 Tax=Providencia sp. JUb39 TaxID=2724165 RepID=UPI00164DACF0|nr:hypothetical protein [Providencia sp. JUb39]